MPDANDHPRILIAPPLLFAGGLIFALIMELLIPLSGPWAGVLRIPGILLLVGGFVLAAYALSRMVQEGTSADPRRAATRLVTSGPYRITRNPIYLGFAVIFLGFTFLAGTCWGILVAPVLMLAVTRLVIDREEVYLAARFPKHYAEYAGRVRRWL